MQFICYPKCGTCQKAEKFLQSHKLEYTKRDIKNANPSADELRSWQQDSGLPLKSSLTPVGCNIKP